MKWILSTLIGLTIAIFCYSLIGALVNLVVGPILGYRVMMCSAWGFAIWDADGRKKFHLTDFNWMPEVLLYAKTTERPWKKLILEIAPIVAGFVLCVTASWYFGNVDGFYRYILISFLSGMAVIYCWHIFILLKMIVNIFEKEDSCKK